MHETPLSKIDARMVARPRGLEDDDIPRAESRAFDVLADFCLFARHAGHVHAVLGAGPVHEPEQSKPLEGDTPPLVYGLPS